MTNQPNDDWVFDPSRYPDPADLTNREWSGPKPMSLCLHTEDFVKSRNLGQDAPRILAECIRRGEEIERFRSILRGAMSHFCGSPSATTEGEPDE